MTVDLLGPAGRAKILSRILLSLQEQEYELTVMKEANGAGDHETVPGENFSYATRLEDLRKAQERVLASADQSVVNGLRRLTDGK